MFQEIPNIVATTFGGVVYGLNFQNNFSSSPSKLTLDIVSENGNYTISDGHLNSNYSVRFGSFRFNGILWSFQKKYTAGERTLHLEVIDQSIILDRYYVLLWKRGMFGSRGSVSKSKTFDFSDQKVLIPYIDTKGWSPRIAFKEQSLGSYTITRTSQQGGGSSGNIIVVGTEQFRDSECDIPTTDYNFSELRGLLPVAVNMSDKNKDYRTTHEGTVRSVLQAWASDFGYDFYWDYDSNQIRFFDVSNGIAGRLPNYTGKEIIEKSESVSMQGTFRQYGISYAAVPKRPPESISDSGTLYFSNSVNPYPLSYFMSKRGYKGSIGGDDSNWGASRSKSEFIVSALLGAYVNKSLRNLYCFQQEFWSVLGYKKDSGLKANKKECINLLKKVGGYAEAIAAMQEIDNDDLSGFNFQFISHDQGLEDTWHKIEAEMIPLLGSTYKCPGSSQSFYYCNKDYILETDITVSPEGSYIEPQSDEFAGQNILQRQGSLSHDSSSLQQILNIDQLIDKIDLCTPKHIELIESGMIDAFVEAKILPASAADKVNTLIIFPEAGFVKKQIGFRVSKIRASNDSESTASEAASAQEKDNFKKCDIFDEQLSGACKSAEEEAREKVMAAVKPPSQENTAPSHGLENKTADGISLSMKGGGNVRFFAPSDAQYTFITTITTRLQKIVKSQKNNELISVNAQTGTANDVAEIRVAFDNMTDSELDEWGVSRKSIVSASTVNGSRRQGKISYKFAGLPSLVLSPSTGLTSLDISLSSDGFKTTVEYSTRPPQPTNMEATLRKVQSQFKRVGY